MTWNLFHGRDHPPDRALLTWRSRLLRVTEVGTAHAQVNRPLRGEFAALIARLPWDVALLQEVPPRWLRPLCEAAGASGASVLTARNFPHLPRAAATWLNPDLIASNEGGSNQLLVRPPWRLVEVARETIARRPERRRMLLARLREPASGRDLAVANLHASTGGRGDEVIAAAERAVAWAAGAPLVFGGDLNLRPEQGAAFDELERRLGLEGATGAEAIDHLLASGLEPRERPRALVPARREIPGPRGRAIRLSDHSPVVAAFEVE